MNHASEVIHDLDLISNSTDKKREEKVQRLKKTMKALRSRHKKLKSKLQ